MTASTDAAYARAVVLVWGACAKWAGENPDARLKFKPLMLVMPLPPGAGVLGGLDQALELGVAANSMTRKLLTEMDRAIPGGATIRMAEYAIQQVYGIPHALTFAKPVN